MDPNINSTELCSEIIPYYHGPPVEMGTNQKTGVSFHGSSAVTKLEEQFFMKRLTK